tara:strand:+ start:4213 stop:4557 length:345 start_codon:yes stop_codon:yes gene_type:complete
VENKQNKQKLTKKETFLKCLRNNLGHISRACESAKISRGTYYKWIDEAEFKEQVDAVNEGLVDHVEHQLLKKIDMGDTTAIIFYLKTKGKNRGYVEKQEVSLSKPIEDINFNEI